MLAQRRLSSTKLLRVFESGQPAIVWSTWAHVYYSINCETATSETLVVYSCCTHKFLRHSVGWITTGMMHDTATGSYACLTLKAYNGRLFVAFLDVCLASHISSTAAPTPECKMAKSCTEALMLWFGQQENAPRFLTDQTPANIRTSLKFCHLKI